MSATSDLRPSPIAGRWYPGDPEELTSEIGTFLEQSKVAELNGEVIGLVVPHAGHRYSGQTAAYAFRTIQGKHFDLVAILSPFHDFHPAEVLTSGHQAYATPLGSIPVDRDAIEKFSQFLIEEGEPSPEEIVFDHEHSLEIELPFLQIVLSGSFNLLPIMVRSRSAKITRAVGKALARVLQNRSALIVASSDLSHFFPENKANQLDNEMLQQISSFSPEGVLQADTNGTAFACGAGAIVATFWAARELGADQVKILHHSTSADETGDHNSVVGYGAAVILKKS